VLGDKKLGKGTGPWYDAIRKSVPFLPEDTYMKDFIDSVHQLVKEREFPRGV
jgi:histidine ammonia-lyase